MSGFLRLMLCVMARAVVPCLFIADNFLYLPIYVPCNGGNPSALTWWSSVHQIFFPAAARQLRNWSSGVIFRHIYSSRAPTIPGSLQAFHMAYCLHHSFFLYTLSIIGWGKSICQVFSGIFSYCMYVHFFLMEFSQTASSFSGRKVVYYYRILRAKIQLFINTML